MGVGMLVVRLLCFLFIVILNVWLLLCFVAKCFVEVVGIIFVSDEGDWLTGFMLRDATFASSTSMTSSFRWNAQSRSF